MAVAAIDVWAQPTPEIMLTSPRYAPLIERAGARERVVMATSPQKVVAAMDEAGVAKLFMCAWCLHDGWLISNSQIVEIVRQFPDRLVGVASANLDDPHAGDELEALVVRHGFKALRIVPWAWNRPPITPAIVRSLRSASSLASRFAPRSATPVRVCPRTRGGRSPISTK